MRLSVISFTAAGMELSRALMSLAGWAADDGTTIEEVRLYTKCGQSVKKAEAAGIPYVTSPVGTWAGEQLAARNALLFIGACGIAVRAIAPYLTDKLHDPPVLVMDEQGVYVIPLLAGHVGGANALARQIGQLTGASPVITTATDLGGQFAVDLFAKKNRLSIGSRSGIAAVSARVLAGETLTVCVAPDYTHLLTPEATEGGAERNRGCGLAWCAEDGNADWNGTQTARLPEQIRRVPYPPAQHVDILISPLQEPFDATLLLIPQEYVIGFGCVGGKDAAGIGRFLEERLREAGISTAQVMALASIDRKRGEAGILQWCRREGIPFVTYTAKELQEVPGDFIASAFVQAQVGVDNVCERAALRACRGAGRLICRKYAQDGMTFALARIGEGT